MPYQLHCALPQTCEELDETTLLDELLGKLLDEGTRLDDDERLEGAVEEELDLLVVTEEVLL